MKREIKWNGRKKEMMTILLESEDYVTIAAVADQLKVSSRTVLRDLEEIGDWLEAAGVRLEKKTGVGIFLKADPQQKEQLQELIEQEGIVKDLNPQERQVLLASELLQSGEPVKLYYLTKILKVSEGTVSNDLDRLETWLASYQLTLIRKPGYGVSVAGHEKHKRRAMINLIYENVNEKQLLTLIQNNLTQSPQNRGSIEIRIRNRLLNLMDQETITKLGELIYQAEARLGYPLSDSAYVGLIVHLALVMKRIKNNEKISMDGDFLQELKLNAEFGIAKTLAQEISLFFHIEINEDEVGYITMHLMGSKNRGSAYRGGTTSASDHWLLSVAKEMILVAEKETGRFLGGNEKLLLGLLNHLEPTVKRLKMKMDIRNPLLNEIKNTYPELIRISEKCGEVLERHLQQKLPESEIAYIAMHLGAVLEKEENLPLRKWRVVVACPSGIGTSRLLATRIEKEYEQIEVIDVVSTIHVGEQLLKQQGIDFVISTVPIQRLDIPVITVSPLFLESDQQAIDELIAGKEPLVRYNGKRTGETVDVREKYARLNEYSQGILQVLNHFFIDEVERAPMEALINYTSQRLVSKAQQARLEQDLLRREQLGATVLPDKGFALLHCRSRAVTALYFGALRLIEGQNRSVGPPGLEGLKQILVMVAPEEMNEGQREVLGEISALMINQPEFLSLLEGNRFEEAYQMISRTLDEFYHRSMEK